MRALVLRAYDGPQALGLVTLSTPQPDKGEVLIKVAAAAINPSDLMFLQGKYGVHPKLPHTAGFEGSGVVVGAGGGFYGHALLGRRVAFTAGMGGTWADYCVCQATTVVPLAPGISLPQGAMLFVNPLTAWALIDTARQHKAKAVVQTAAASALGRMVVRLGQRFDLPIINIVRRQEQVDTLHAIGAAHVLNSSAADFTTEFRQLCHDLQATVGFDAVAGDMPGLLLRAMPRHATVYVYGALGDLTVPIGAGELIFRDQRLHGFYLGAWVTTQHPARLLRVAVDVQRMLGDVLRSEVRACMPLEAHQRAIDLYSNDMTGGKILFVPDLR